MYGLIIKKKWLDLIMSGKKTLEIRGCRTSHVPVFKEMNDKGENCHEQIKGFLTNVPIAK